MRKNNHFLFTRFLYIFLPAVAAVTLVYLLFITVIRTNSGCFKKFFL